MQVKAMTTEAAELKADDGASQGGDDDRNDEGVGADYSGGLS